MPAIPVNGLDLYYELAGSGPPVALIAGLGGDCIGWQETQVPAFTAAGFQCVSFDNRDAGRTSGPETAYDIRQLAADAAALLEELKLGPAHVVGASMGGMIAQELALNHPQCVRSLTLVCTAATSDAFIRNWVASMQAARTGCPIEEFFRTFCLWMFTHRFFDQPGALDQFLGLALANPWPQTAEGFQRQCDAIATHDAANGLGALRVPAHVIVGDEDILTGTRYSRSLAEAIPGAALTVVPECGHALFWEKPAAFNAVVLDFLRRQD